jgi:NADPH:quinone reductase-like Zn-dependent oxidoreductase
MEIQPIIDLIYPLEDGVDASFILVATGKAKGKVTISMSQTANKTKL